MKVEAILFDLHHTLTGTRIPPFELLRDTGHELDIQLNRYSDEQLQAAFQESDSWLRSYLITTNADIHWGNDPSEWLQADRIMFETLGINGLADEVILEFERRWRKAIRGPRYEYFTEEAFETLSKLNDRGYTLGICTRRFHNPSHLIKTSGLEDVFAVVTWSAVPGYAKPNPFTLLDAAAQIAVNPRLCAYVGNLVDADIEAAKRGEMIPILTTWADPSEGEKAPEDTIVVGLLLELLEIFN